MANADYVKTERNFGIVQGRLTVPPEGLLQWFPQENWREEFTSAEKLGISFIELLTERYYNSHNPVWTPSGREEIRSVAKTTQRILYSNCTDYIIDHSLLGSDAEQVKQHVREFLDASMDLGCSVAVFPLLEESNLTSESAQEYIPVMQEFARQVRGSGMTLCIESLMQASDLKQFLESIDDPSVKCVFDTGNRVVDHQDLASEIQLLGDWVKHFHIKDKKPTGENVLMGRGLVDFLSVFEALEQINYTGPLVFETTRGTDPLVTANYHMGICRFFTQEASNVKSS